MIFRVLILIAFASGPGGGTSDAQTRPTLAGTWHLDPARSTSSGGGSGARDAGAGGGRGGGLGLGPSPDTLIITQDDTSLRIEERRGVEISRVAYALDGKPATNRLAAGRNAGGSTTAISTWQEGVLVTLITAPAAPGTPGTVQYRERRWIDRDGSLIVETSLVAQPNVRRAVYKKAARLDLTAARPADR